MYSSLEYWHVANAVNCGENSLILYFTGASLTEKNQHVRRFTQALNYQHYDWLVELVPSFDSVMLTFDGLAIDQYDVFQWLKQLPDNQHTKIDATHHIISVCYDRAQKLDLVEIAQTLNCTIDEVIAMHANNTYTTFAVGFSPGFAYLGELDEALQLPRRATPRTKVPAGAVAIAERYTAVYPSESPGGWNLIGIIARDQQSMLSRNIRVGDTVQFVDNKHA